MVGMPHMITKGPELSVMDDHYSLKGDVTERIRILNHLESDLPVSDEGTLAAISLDFVTGPNAQFRELAFNRDWFGYDPNGDAQSDSAKAPTGWWTSWQGDAEGICREALIRAIRLSLGMSRSDGLNGLATVDQVVFINDPINISFRWSCGAPTFEAYVEWDTSPTGRYVIVTFSTPPNGEEIWLDFGASAQAKHGYGLDPTDPKDEKAPTGTKGVWLVAHKQTYKRIAAKPIGTPVTGVLNLTSPASWLSGSDGEQFSPIVTVDIPADRGGVSDPPHTWA